MRTTYMHIFWSTTPGPAGQPATIHGAFVTASPVVLAVVLVEAVPNTAPKTTSVEKRPEYSMTRVICGERSQKSSFRPLRLHTLSIPARWWGPSGDGGRGGGARRRGRVKYRLGDQRGGSEWEPIKIILQRENLAYDPNSQLRIPTRVCQGSVVTADLPTLRTNLK
jgi:hypothetical protein